MAKVAINGFGRIGRATFRIILGTQGLDIVAINDLVPADNLSYLLKYDTVYGRYEGSVNSKDNNIVVNGEPYRVYSEKDPSNLPWEELGVDLVFECTGLFTKKQDLQKHLDAGAKRVILSAPSKSEEVVTVVHGVNKPGNNENIISCASCTTNCITPVVEVMERRVGILKAVMTTIHAYTASQAIVDSPNRKFRRGRAGAANLVPTSTGAAIATTKVISSLDGKFDGLAVRAPVPVGSIADLVFVTGRNTSKEEINSIFEEESQSEKYNDVLGVSRDPIVSSDIIMDPRASVVDLEMTQVIGGDLVKLMCWYDNEWGYANQMVREAKQILQQ